MLGEKNEADVQRAKRENRARENERVEEAVLVLWYRASFTVLGSSPSEARML